MTVDVGDLAPAGFYVSLWAAGWVVNATRVPADYQVTVAAGLVLLGAVGVSLALSALDVDVSGGRCRAETAEGARCKLPRGPFADLCHVHQRTHGTELHPDAVEGARGGGRP